MTGRSAVVIGTTSLDLVADSDDAEFARTAAGNSGSNIAVRLAALGWQTELVALVGDDDLAPLVRADLAAWGVGVDGVVSRSGYRTPRVFHVVTERDSHLLFVCPRCGRPRGHTLDLPDEDEIPDSVWAAIERADVVVADIAQPLAVAAARRTTASIVWYEQSLHEATPADMRALAAVADVIKVSSDDLDHYAPAESVAGAGLRLVTLGADGVRAETRDDASSWTEYLRVPGEVGLAVVDTIGAGDAFTATAIDRMSAGAELDEVLAAATGAAGRACEAVGARGDMIEGGRTKVAGAPSRIPFRCALCDAGV